MPRHFIKIWEKFVGYDRKKIGSIIFVILFLFVLLAIFFDKYFFVGIKIFFSHNGERFLEIYWNTILILLTLFVPIGMKIINSFEKRFPKFGPQLFLQRFIQVKDFYLLVPLFSFSLLFVPKVAQNGIDIFFHISAFVLWVILFWRFFRILERCVMFWVNQGEDLNRYFYGDLKKLKSGDVEDIAEKWSAVWQTIGQLKWEWQVKFLSLFWEKQREFFNAGKCALVSNLFEDFSTRFLFLEDDVKNDQDRYMQWYNERRRFLWFHGANFDDGRENPHGIFERLLNFYRDAWRKREHLKEEEKSASEKWGYWNSIELFEKISGILERILRDELEHSDNSYYGLFCILRKHIETTEKILEDAKKRQEYLRSIPMYIPFFDNANKYDLQEYTPGDKNDTSFPNEWRIRGMTIQSLSIAQVVWINKFFEWSHSRIDHGEKPYDEKLEGSLKMLFPDARQSWMALAIAYRNLSWGGGNRLESLCRWKQNFGMWGDEIGWYDYDSSQSDKEREEKRELYEKERQENTVNIMRRLNLMRELMDDPEASKRTLDQLEETFPNNSPEELNRRDILELLSYIIKSKNTNTNTVGTS